MKFALPFLIIGIASIHGAHAGIGTMFEGVGHSFRRFKNTIKSLSADDFSPVMMIKQKNNALADKAFMLKYTRQYEKDPDMSSKNCPLPKKLKNERDIQLWIAWGQYFNPKNEGFEMVTNTKQLNTIVFRFYIKKGLCGAIDVRRDSSGWSKRYAYIAPNDHVFPAPGFQEPAIDPKSLKNPALVDLEAKTKLIPPEKAREVATEELKKLNQLGYARHLSLGFWKIVLHAPEGVAVAPHAIAGSVPVYVFQLENKANGHSIEVSATGTIKVQVLDTKRENEHDQKQAFVPQGPDKHDQKPISKPEEHRLRYQEHPRVQQEAEAEGYTGRFLM